MTDDDLEAIREQKREELQAQLQGEDRGGDTPVEPIHVDGPTHLDDILGEHHVVLADFYADWCGPCRMLEPVLERVAADTDAAVAKIDADAHQQLTAEYGVRGLPTLVLFSDGEAAEQLVGMQDETTLTNLVEQHA